MLDSGKFWGNPLALPSYRNLLTAAASWAVLNMEPEGCHRAEFPQEAAPRTVAVSRNRTPVPEVLVILDGPGLADGAFLRRA